MHATKQRLIDAATELLDAGGPAAVTLRTVGAAAGVSHNTPYRHFADKDDLLATVAATELRALAAAVTAAAEARLGTERLVAAGGAYLDWARAHPARFALVFGAWSGSHEELGMAAAMARRAIHDTVVLAQAEDRTLPADADAITAAVWSVAHGAIHLDLAGHLGKEPGSPRADDVVARTIGLVAQRSGPEASDRRRNGAR